MCLCCVKVIFIVLIYTETTVTTFVEVTFTAQPASSTIKSKPVISTVKPQPSTFKPQLATSTFKEQLVTATFKPQTATSTATAQLATSPPMEATTTMYGTTYSTSDVLYAWANDMPTGISNFNMLKGVFAKD